MLLEPVNAITVHTSLVPGDLLDDLDTPVGEHLTQLVTFLVFLIEIDACHIADFVPLDGGRLIKDLRSAAIDVERLVLINGVEYIVPVRSCFSHIFRALHIVCLLSIMVHLFDNFASLRCTVGKKLPAEFFLAVLFFLVFFLFFNVFLSKSEGLGVRFSSHILHTVVGTHFHIVDGRVSMSGYLRLLDRGKIRSFLLTVNNSV